MNQLDTLRTALQWYAMQAKAMTRHSNSTSGESALIATMQTLAADGGRRAEEALARRETDKDPT